MNVEKYVNDVLINNHSLSFEERETIIGDIHNRTFELPIQEPFTKEQLEQFSDKDLIHYIADIYELIAIRFFLKYGKREPEQYYYIIR